MSGKSLRLLVLLALLAGLIVVLWMQPAGSPPAGVGSPPSNSTATEADTAGAPAVVAEVRLDQLTAAPPAVSAPTRDPFRFRPAPAPPPPAAMADPPPQRFDDAPPVFMPPPGPQVQPIPLRLQGVLEPPRARGELIGVFVGMLPGQPNQFGGQGVVFYGRAGDVIEGRYRVLRVGPDSADVAHLDGSGRQTLRMSGQ